MKFISWNVNGLRAVVKHDFAETFNQLDADSFCIQETKMQEGQLELNCRAIINTSVTQSGRDILGPQFSLSTSL